MISLLQRYISSASLRQKILIGFILIILINLFLFTVTFILYANLMTNMAVDNSRISMRIASQGIKSILNDTFNLSNSIAENKIFRETINTSLDEPILSEIIAERKNDLVYIPSYYPHILGLNVIGTNGTVIQSSSDEFDESLYESYWFHHLLGLNEPTWYRCDTGSIVSTDNNVPVIYLSVSMYNESNEKIGIVITDIQIKTIQTIIDESIESVGKLFLFKESLTIAPDDISLFTEDAYLNRVNKNLAKNVDDILEDRNTIFVSEDVGINEWKMVGIIDKMILLHKTNIIRTSSFISLLFTIIISSILALIISKTVTSPISILIQLMKKVENGNLQVEMSVVSKDEVGQLGDSFNVMVKRIKYLVTSIYDDQIKLRKAELTALQAQINPHFLYNTLESINWLARYKKNDQIIKMISSLTILFRTSINRNGNIIRISEEMAHVKSYLTIQQMRYPNSFIYEINISDNVLQYYTVKLIVQPIVENAIYHGVKLRDEKGLIKLTSEETDNIIRIIIEDNGPGMNEETVELLNSKQLDKLNRMDSSGYGLKNVDDRIKIFFGKEYGLHFSSISGLGTRVIIQLPKRIDRKVYDQSYSYR